MFRVQTLRVLWILSTATCDIPFSECVSSAPPNLLERLKTASTQIITILGSYGFYEIPRVLGGLIHPHLSFFGPLTFIFREEIPVPAEQQLFEAEYRLAQILGSPVVVTSETNLSQELLKEALLLTDLIFQSTLQTHLSSGLVQSVFLRDGRVLCPLEISEDILPKVVIIHHHLSQLQYILSRQREIARREALLTTQVTDEIRNLSNSLCSTILKALDDFPAELQPNILAFITAEKKIDQTIKSYFIDHSQIAADLFKHSISMELLSLYNFQKEMVKTPAELDRYPFRSCLCL